MGKIIFEGVDYRCPFYSRDTFMEFIKQRFPRAEEMSRIFTFLHPYNVALKYISEQDHGTYNMIAHEKIHAELFGDESSIGEVEKIIAEEAKKHKPLVVQAAPY